MAKSTAWPAGALFVCALAWVMASMRADLVPEAALLLVALASAVSAVWLVARSIRYALTRRTDERAYHRVERLAALVHAPGRRLVEITGAEWLSQAGQRATAVDIANGQHLTLWFSQTYLPVGTFAVVDEVAAVVGWMSPADVVAANRHRKHAVATCPTLPPNHCLTLADEVEHHLRSAARSQD